MSNEKRFVVKHGLQSQNMEFVSPDKAKRISVSMLDSGTISFSGDSGELFSVTDTMAGTIFAVNDISGMPSLEIDDDGIVRIAETIGNVLIGTTTDNGKKLQVAGSASVSGNLSVNGSISATSGDLNLDTLDLNAITTSKAVTAVDVFVYDTSKDSDGGAWRKRTQHTSWYNETLNTATRGSRKEFPAVAVIVTEATKVTIYDGDDPMLPMWMVFEVGSNKSIAFGVQGTAVPTGIVMLNGVLFVSVKDQISANPYSGYINFLSEENIQYGTNAYRVLRSIANRNTTALFVLLNSNLNIVNKAANDVAMTVLPNAPVDAATGLSVPTIAVATDGGVSVIKDNGTVIDWMTNVGISSNVVFTEWGGIQTSGGGGVGYATWGINSIPVSDTNTYDYLIGSSWSSTQISRQGSGGNSTLLPLISTNYGTANAENAGISTNNKLMLIDANQSTYGYSLVSYITPSYNTGWMQGNIKGAFLANTTTKSLVSTGLITNGNFDTDTTGWAFPNDNATATTTSVTGGVLTYGNLTNSIWPKINGGGSFAQPGCTYKVTINVTDIQSTDGSPSTIAYVDVGTVVGRANKTITAPGSYDFIVTNNLTFAVGVSIILSHGDLSSISITSITAVDVVEDRSIAANPLIVNGTITSAPVTTGAGLVAYSGFSTTNYLEQPYNSGLDFGTGDFCVMGWMKGGNVGQVILDRRNPTNLAQAGFYLYIDTTPADTIRFATGDSTNYSTTNSNSFVTGLYWKHFCVVRDVSGTRHSIYINGVLDKTSTVVARNVNNTNATLTLGLESEKDQYPFTGSLALLRISATAPTADQIAKIYNDEKFLFQENAACTLYGSSDAVTALAHDSDTGLLHVGTSAGRSVFQGLRRVSNTTNPVGTAISACNGLVVEE